MSVVLNAADFISDLDTSVERFERKFGLRMKALVNEAMDRLLAKTPVWTGQAAASYRASSGSPSSSSPAQSGKPVEATNKLSLGSERLRGAAESQSRASLSSVNVSDPFQTYWIVNRSPNIAGLEAGLLPEEPYRPRSPNGMFQLTLLELAASLGKNGVL